MTKTLAGEILLPPGPTDTGTATLVKTPTSVTRGTMDTVFGRPEISWPRGLVAAFTFGEAAGTGSVTSDAGMRSITVPLRNGVHAKSTELGPFGPMLELDGATLFALENDPGILDLAQYGDQVTAIAMVKNKKDSGIWCVGGVHREGSFQPSRQFALYDNAPAYGGAFRVSPHIGAQDGATPFYPYNVNYGATARHHGPLFGAADGYDILRTIAGTYDGQQIRAYLDGLTDSYPSFTEPDGLQLTVSKNPYPLDKGLNRSSTPKDFSIGGATNRLDTGALLPINMMKGSLAVLAFFNRALTPEEIMGVQIQLQRRLSKQLGVVQPFTWLDFNIRDANGTRPLSLLGLRGYEGTAGTPTHDLTTGNGWRLNGTSQASGRDFLFRSAETPGLAFFPTEKSFRASQLRRVRLLLNSSAMTAQVRFVLCVGGQWYATHQTAAMSKDGASGTSWATTAEQKILALGLEAGIWRKLTLAPGDATPVLMTNLMADPQGSGSSFISVPGTGAAASGAPQPAGGADSEPFWRTTWTTGSTDVSGGVIVSGDNLVTPGKSYSAGLPVRCSKNQTVILQVQFVNADGVVIGSRNGPATQLTANAFGQVRTSYVATAPAGAVRARLFVRAAGDGVPWVAADKLDLKKPMLVEGSYLPPTHFAGTQPVPIPSGLSLDATATTENIPNGTVEAFGIYSDAGAGTHRIAEIALYDTAA
ncbi:hypothetical protein [Microbacterium sp. CFBP 8794]|uniref:hypothetical protein n=1 Tax=Microbacterium sp. CFBP 8794 TaxID=2775269 RepID=UPI00177B3292|nr:hypothetical protein [Microbacterium sp. CFBP 8794]MBD8477549.1 hypothetical protein [Microbacterium sp. CFBP 8794]